MSATPDVVFVVIDSARKERLSAYGHNRHTTPAFDAFAAEATLYENAFTPAPWTLPSHCSMFTGRFPSEHGITNGFTDRDLHLTADIETVAEQLAARGYATAGFSNNPWVGKLSDLNRGFDRFVEWDLEMSRIDQSSSHRLRDQAYSKLHAIMGRAAGQPQALLKRRFFTSNLIERATRWIADTADQPSFTFLNLMEAHSPYYPPRGAFTDLGLETPGPVEPRTLNAKLLAYVMGKTDLDSSTRERVMEYYDASLRYQDGQLATLLSSLRSHSVYEDAVIVICADHGKTLGDYDRNATPPHYVRDINVNVPLSIKWPSQHAGERVAEPVELTDLFDVMVAPEPATALPARADGALIEDYVPHTAKHATDVVRWRVLADATTKYVQSDEGDEFLFDRSETEVPVDGAVADYPVHRDRLQTRVERLAAPSESAASTADGDLRKGVEGQLQDLGYLS